MKLANYTLVLDSEVCERVRPGLMSLGITLDGAVNMALACIDRHNGIPFHLMYREPTFEEALNRLNFTAFMNSPENDECGDNEE